MSTKSQRKSTALRKTEWRMNVLMGNISIRLCCEKYITEIHVTAIQKLMVSLQNTLLKQSGFISFCVHTIIYSL